MEAVVMRYQQAMCRKSADDLAELYAVDAVHEIPFQVPGFPPRFEGREQIRAAYSAMWGMTPVVIEQVETTALHQATDHETVIVEQVAHGRALPDGPALSVPSLLVLRIRDGLILWCRDYMDGLAVASARSAGHAAP